jgi:hypothetical protein
MAFVRDATTFYLLRFLLGAASRLLPRHHLLPHAVVPSRERAHAVALMTGTAIAGVIGDRSRAACCSSTACSGCAAGSGSSSSKGFRPSCSRRWSGGVSIPAPPRRAGCRRPNAPGSSRPWRRRRTPHPARITTCAGPSARGACGVWPPSTSASCWPSTA